MSGIRDSIRISHSLARKELEAGQHPFAVILSCADSRFPPELLFDQGLGDLFVVRVAGNIVDDAVLGSIEYAVTHLGAKLVMVLGHEKCGAVSAAVEGGMAAGHISALVAAIQPSVEASGKEPGDRVHSCVIANARRVAQQVRESEPVLKDAVSKQGEGRGGGLRSGFREGQSARRGASLVSRRDVLKSVEPCRRYCDPIADLRRSHSLYTVGTRP